MEVLTKRELVSVKGAGGDEGVRQDGLPLGDKCENFYPSSGTGTGNYKKCPAPNRAEDYLFPYFRVYKNPFRQNSSKREEIMILLQTWLPNLNGNRSNIA